MHIIKCPCWLPLIPCLAVAGQWCSTCGLVRSCRGCTCAGPSVGHALDIASLQCLRHAALQGEDEAVLPQGDALPSSAPQEEGHEEPKPVLHSEDQQQHPPDSPAAEAKQASPEEDISPPLAAAQMVAVRAPEAGSEEPDAAVPAEPAQLDNAAPLTLPSLSSVKPPLAHARCKWEFMQQPTSASIEGVLTELDNTSALQAFTQLLYLIEKIPAGLCKGARP